MVAKNHCLMKLRNKHGRKMKELNDDLSIETSERDSNELMANEQTYLALEECLEELNEEQKLCVTLFYLHKKSYQEISEKTGYNPMQVKSYIQNGKRNLRLLVEKNLKNKASF
jgi:RNA polymerase sigma-70 factor (ECF subfamily)